jgi:hypothetical protein
VVITDQDGRLHHEGVVLMRDRGYSHLLHKGVLLHCCIGVKYVYKYIYFCLFLHVVFDLSVSRSGPRLCLGDFFLCKVFFNKLDSDFSGDFFLP